MKSLAASLATQRTDLAVLPPLGGAVPNTFHDLEVDDYRYRELLGRMQRFRGSIYLSEGAILPTQLSVDGRHTLPSDEDSWHILTLDQDQNICACIRFHEARPTMHYAELGVARSALARCAMWGETFRKAVEMERFNAQADELRFGEAGGWAISADRRNTLDSIRTALGTFSLLRLLGGGVGFATATCKHGSASILKRLGLSPLVVEGKDLPPYYDPHYRSEMEMLRFDSKQPNPKYANWVADIASNLAAARVTFAEHRVGASAKLDDRSNVKHWTPVSPAQKDDRVPLTV